MPRFTAAFIALVAPLVLAVPSYPKYGPAGYVASDLPSGYPIQPTGSAPYPIGNSTTNGPTGTGTGAVSTIAVATTSGSNGGSSEGLGGSDANTSPLAATGGNGECGPATVTVTSANTVTVTVGASTSVAPSSTLVATSTAPFGNDTTVAPIGTGTGSTDIYIPSISTGSPILPTTSAAHGFRHAHLHHSAPAPKPAPVPQVESSSSVTPAVFAESTPEAQSTTVAAAEEPSPAPFSPVEQPKPEPTSSTVETTTAAGEPSLAPYSPVEEFKPEPTPSTVETTAAAAPTSPATPPSSGGAVKPRGLVYNTATLTEIFSTSAVGWCYNWNSVPGGDVPEGLNYVPMLWGDNQYHIPHWKENADKAIEAGATHLLGFNEPDLGSQANMTPDHATQTWKEQMEQYAGKVKLGSPSVCNGGGPVGNGATIGLNWLNNFLKSCSDCTVDFLTIHWYGQAWEVEGFKNHVSDAKKLANGKPIWITEFKPEGSAEEQTKFLEEILPWLDSESGVERYAVFQVDGVLTNGNALSDIGKMYNS